MMKTTSGSAPLYLNSVLQTYVPSRSLCKWTAHYCAIPKNQITFTDFFINCSHLVELPAQTQSGVRFPKATIVASSVITNRVQ